MSDDKLTAILWSGDLTAKTYLQDRVKAIKFTNEVCFEKTETSKKQKIVVEVTIDKFHHEIVTKVNGIIVQKGFAP